MQEKLSITYSSLREIFWEGLCVGVRGGGGGGGGGVIQICHTVLYNYFTSDLRRLSNSPMLYAHLVRQMAKIDLNRQVLLFCEMIRHAFQAVIMSTH